MVIPDKLKYFNVLYHTREGTVISMVKNSLKFSQVFPANFEMFSYWMILVLHHQLLSTGFPSDVTDIPAISPMRQSTAVKTCKKNLSWHDKQHLRAKDVVHPPQIPSLNTILNIK